jgi:hypothetical protein
VAAGTRRSLGEAAGSQPGRGQQEGGDANRGQNPGLGTDKELREGRLRVRGAMWSPEPSRTHLRKRTGGKKRKRRKKRGRAKRKRHLVRLHRRNQERSWEKQCA